MQCVDMMINSISTRAWEVKEEVPWHKLWEVKEEVPWHKLWEKGTVRFPRKVVRAFGSDDFFF